MTAAEERFLDKCARDGEAWFVPSQTRMVRRLIRQGLPSCIPKATRYNRLRGSHERRVTPKATRPGADEQLDLLGGST